MNRAGEKCYANYTNHFSNIILVLPIDNAMENISQKDSRLKGNQECGVVRVETLNRVMRVGFTEKLRF